MFICIKIIASLPKNEEIFSILITELRSGKKVLLEKDILLIYTQYPLGPLEMYKE